jgi:hypothetical protein
MWRKAIVLNFDGSFFFYALAQSEACFGMELWSYGVEDILD